MVRITHVDLPFTSTYILVINPRCAHAHDAEYYRAQLTGCACKSMTHHFQSAGSLSIGSQIHGSQVTLEPGAEGLHSGFRSSAPSLHSQAPHISINIKVNSTEQTTPLRHFPHLLRPNNKRGNCNRSPETPQPFHHGRVYGLPCILHCTLQKPQSQRNGQRRKESPDTTSGDSSTPKLSPLPPVATGRFSIYLLFIYFYLAMRHIPVPSLHCTYIYTFVFSPRVFSPRLSPARNLRACSEILR